MQKRQTQIELLRIVCMIMIVAIHVLGQGGILWKVTDFSANYFLVWFLEAVILCAVNCFALISGYVGYRSSFKISRWILLWFQVVFYGIVMLGIFTVISGENFSVLQLKRAVMPYTQGQYWYISAYAGMFFLIPVMNAAIINMRRKQLLGCLISVFFVYTVLPTVFHQDPFQLQYGYCVLWLCVLYLAGGYLGKYEVPAKVGLRKGLFLYFSCVLITWLGKTMVEWMTFQLLGEIKYGYLFIDYTTPFAVFAGIGLLTGFANIRVKNETYGKGIRIIASATLGVYILHVQPFIFEYVITDLTVNLSEEAVWYILMMIVVYVVVIYASCTLIELIRRKIFELLHIPQLAAILEKKARNCFDRICKKAGIDE